MKDKILLLVFIFLFCAINVRAQFGGGSGTEADPYKITTAEHLAALADLVEAGNEYMGKYFRVENDIDLDDWITLNSPSEGWKPIGYVSGAASERPFCGYFDGGGHTISGMYINNSLLQTAGLFGYLKHGAVVKNVRVLGSTIACSYSGSSVGGIVGRVYCQIATGEDSVVVAGCESSVEIRGTAHAGGIVGHIQAIAAGDAKSHVVVRNCINNGRIAEGTDLGGIVGYFSSVGSMSGSGEARVTIKQCGVGGGLIGHDLATAAGGIVGNGLVADYGIGFCSGTFDIKNCYVTTDISGDFIVGGIIGRINGSGTVSIDNCYAAVKITGAAPDAGAVVGKIDFTTLVGCCSYYDSDLAAGIYQGMGPNANAPGFTVTGKTTVEMHRQSSFTGWEFGNIWTMIQDTSYPYFISQSAPATAFSATPLGISFTLNTAIEGWAIHGSRNENSSYSGNLAADKHVISYISRATDTLNLYLYENGQQVSYGLRTIVSNNDFCGGSGTESDPYLICGAAALARLASMVNDDEDCAGEYFRVTEDIDLSDWIAANDPTDGWLPIGYIRSSNQNIVMPFRGRFDGDNHTISGMYIHRPDSVAVGLFGLVSDTAVIKNIRLEGTSITGNEFVGGIVGRAYFNLNNGASGTPADSLVIANCTNAVQINGGTPSSGNVHTGGIVGMAIGYDDISGSRITVRGCTNTGQVAGGNSFSVSYTGGIVGKIEGFAVNLRLAGCTNNAIINGSPSNGSYTGGIAGQINEYIDNIHAISAVAEARNCVNSGEVKGGIGTAESLTGGIVGLFSDDNFSGSAANARLTVAGCFNGGLVTEGGAASGGSGITFTGGIAGSFRTGGPFDVVSIENCYSVGVIRGNTNTGGIVGGLAGGSVVNITVKNCYAAVQIKGNDLSSTGALAGKPAFISFIGDYFNKDLYTQAAGGGDLPTGVAAVSGAEMNRQSTFGGWNFTDVWNIKEAKSYPYLKNQSAPVYITSADLTFMKGDYYETADSVVVFDARGHRLGKASISGGTWTYTLSPARAYGDTLSAVCHQSGKPASYAASIILKAVTGIALTQHELTLAPGAVETLTATVTPSDASNKTISWDSKDPAVVTVDASGIVTGVAAGTAYVRAITQSGNKKDSCLVTVSALSSRIKASIKSPAGAPITDAMVLVYDVKEGYTEVDTMKLDGESYYSKELPASNYIVESTVSGYSLTYYAGASVWQNATILELTPGTEREITVTMNSIPTIETGDITISGQLKEVIGPLGRKPQALARPFKNATVLLHSPSLKATSNLVLVATTKPDEETGAYEFKNLPKGTYYVSIDMPGYQMAGSNIKVIATASGEVYGKNNFVVDETTKTISSDAVTSAPMLEEIVLRIYPNPITDVLRIEGLEGSYAVKVLNMLGQVVLTETGTSSEVTLNLGNQPSGLYLVKIESQGKTITRKVMKK